MSKTARERAQERTARVQARIDAIPDVISAHHAALRAWDQDTRWADTHRAEQKAALKAAFPDQATRTALAIKQANDSALAEAEADYVATAAEIRERFDAVRVDAEARAIERELARPQRLVRGSLAEDGSLSESEGDQTAERVGQMVEQARLAGDDLRLRALTLVGLGKVDPRSDVAHDLTRIEAEQTADLRTLEGEVEARRAAAVEGGPIHREIKSLQREAYGQTAGIYGPLESDVLGLSIKIETPSKGVIRDAEPTELHDSRPATATAVRQEGNTFVAADSGQA